MTDGEAALAGAAPRGRPVPRLDGIWRSIDRFTLLLLATVVLATVVPARGGFAAGVDGLADISVITLFFLHGARLQRETVIAGLLHWRLHLTVLAISFLFFPLVGLAAMAAADGLAPAAHLGAGLLFLCCLPSTVQSSIAFVTIARGNVGAAVCAASASNLLGILFTPILVGLLLSAHGQLSFAAVGSLFAKLLLPFVAGQIMHRRLGPWIGRNKAWLGPIDRGAILLMVYSAFGAAVLGGLWQRMAAGDVALLFGFCAAMLAIIMGATAIASRRMGFVREDRVTILFCGSKKSLVTGVPMASVLFPAALAGTVVLPLMIFHQLQLVVCAVLARRFAASAETG